MASLALTVQLFVDGAWTTYPGYSADGWSVQIGPDVESGLQPSKVEYVLASDDLSMDPSNPAGPLFGKIGRNTPTRIQISGASLTQAEASTWTPERTPEHVPGTTRGRSWVSVTAEGLLRRIGRWDDPIDSPLRRQIGQYPTLLGYWPLEDPAGTARLAQTAPTIDAGLYSGNVNLAGDPGPGGSDRTLTVSNGATVSGAFRAPSGNGYQISFAVRLNALPGSATYGTIFAFTDSQGRTFSWQVNNTTYRTVWQDADGTALDTAVIGVQPLLTWTRMRVRVTVSGGTVTYEPAWYTQDAASVVGITSTFAGTTTGRPRTWSIPGNANTDSAGFGHVFAVTDTTLDLVGSGDARNAFNGYIGERSAGRFYRLLVEAGLSGFVYSVTTTNLSTTMGRQKPGRLLDLLAECARTDAALIYDEPLGIALTFRGNSDMINRTPALALTLSTIAPPLVKDITDAAVVNDITATNSDGSEVHVERTTGRLSTAPPPAGVGRYRKTLDVNVSDPDRMLYDRASFQLAQGTVDRARYRQVRVDLLANPGLRGSINTMRPGDLITLTGVEADVVNLMVMTIERSGGAVQEIVTFTCLPYDVWFTGVYDGTVRRQDSASTTLAAGATSAATSLSLTTANLWDAWSTTTPYDLLVAGERVTVTAMTAVAGTGPWTQTATVTRSVNGVVKAQTSGAEVHTFNPARYAYGGF